MQFSQEPGHVALAAAHGLPGAAHDVLGHAEPLGDFQAGGLARQAQTQAKRRIQRLFIEAHGAIDHALGSGAVDFERQQVGGNQGVSAGRAEMLDDGHAQRAALFGVGGCAQFVQKHQRIGRDIERHLADVGDVRGKRAQVFLNGLIVADIGQHLVEEGELSLGGGHGKGRLRHQAEQTHGLQRHRLAAGTAVLWRRRRTSSSSG